MLLYGLARLLNVNWCLAPSNFAIGIGYSLHITGTFDVVDSIYVAPHMALHCGNSSVTAVRSSLWITEVISDSLNACVLSKDGKRKDEISTMGTSGIVAVQECLVKY